MRFIIITIIVMFMTLTAPAYIPYTKNKKLVEKHYLIKQKLFVVCLYYGLLRYTETLERLIQVESSYKSRALSFMDARGLMQVRPICLTDYNTKMSEKIDIEALYNPLTNLIVGCWYFKQCLRSADDLPEALSMYNAGWSHDDFMHGYVEKILGCKNGSF